LVWVLGLGFGLRFRVLGRITTCYITTTCNNLIWTESIEKNSAIFVIKNLYFVNFCSLFGLAFEIS